MPPPYNGVRHINNHLSHKGVRWHTLFCALQLWIDKM